MPAKTTHIFPTEDGWVVKKEREGVPPARAGASTRVSPSNASAGIATIVYSTQREAVEAARKIANRSTSGQIVIHSRGGSLRWRDIRGLPAVRKTPVKSSLGTKAIERAVSMVLRRRIESG